MKCLAVLLILYILISGFADDKPKEGYIQVKGGRIWYKITGKGKGTPLLIIHGGPGSRSCESIPVYSELGNDRPIIFYDQLGSGNSDRPNDTSLWVLPRFVDEITAIRKTLKLNQVNLLGNSWGAAIAIEYLVTQKPKGVNSVIFSGPLISSIQWMKDGKLLLQQLPKNMQDTIQKYEDLKRYDAPSYIAATDSFYSRFLTRKQWPIAKSILCEGVGKFNDQIYNQMWGPTEFNATGSLKNFDRSKQLCQLKLPVLFIAGQYDEVRIETIRKFQKKVHGSKIAIISNSGHMKTVDNPLQYTKSIRNFLSTVK